MKTILYILLSLTITSVGQNQGLYGYDPNDTTFYTFNGKWCVFSVEPTEGLIYKFDYQSDSNSTSESLGITYYNNFYDLSENGNTFTATGTERPIKTDDGAVFDGINDQMSATIDLSTSFTIYIRAKLNSLTEFQSFFGYDNTYLYAWYSTGSISAQLFDNTEVIRPRSVTATMQQDVLYNMFLTFNTTSKTVIYTVVDLATDDDTNILFTNLSATADFRIGSRGATGFTNMTLLKFYIYNRVLTNEELSILNQINY